MHNQLFIADSPDKAAGGSGLTAAQQVPALFASAQQEVHIASPYFIPGEAGLRLLRAVGATQDNGRVVLVTNSIGSTDEPLAYAAYAQQRLAMLQAGVRIYEIGAELGARMPRSGDFGASQSALHAKAATVDGRRLFIGSMNLDPRSALINTEIGLLIDSPPLARTTTALSRRSLVYDAYRCVCRPTASTSNGWSRAPTGPRRCMPSNPAATGASGCRSGCCSPSSRRACCSAGRLGCPAIGAPAAADHQRRGRRRSHPGQDKAPCNSVTCKGPARWWRFRDSNPGPADYDSVALTD